MTAHLALPLALGALTLGLVACGDDDTKSEKTIASSTPTTATTSTTAAGGPASGDADLGVVVDNAKDLGKKPKMEITAEFQAEKLGKKDLVAGQGPKAKKGDKVTVRYVGVGFNSEKQFDASWDRPDNSFDFELGKSEVIRGWDQGVVGMRVGGRRLLVIPGDLAYGAQGSPPSIQANETLAFVVDLKKIK